MDEQELKEATRLAEEFAKRKGLGGIEFLRSEGGFHLFSFGIGLPEPDEEPDYTGLPEVIWVDPGINKVIVDRLIRL